MHICTILFFSFALFDGLSSVFSLPIGGPFVCDLNDRDIGIVRRDALPYASAEFSVLVPRGTTKKGPEGGEKPKSSRLRRQKYDQDNPGRASALWKLNNDVNIAKAKDDEDEIKKALEAQRQYKNKHKTKLQLKFEAPLEEGGSGAHTDSPSPAVQSAGHVDATHATHNPSTDAGGSGVWVHQSSGHTDYVFDKQHSSGLQGHGIQAGSGLRGLGIKDIPSGELYSELDPSQDPRHHDNDIHNGLVYDPDSKTYKWNSAH